MQSLQKIQPITGIASASNIIGPGNNALLGKVSRVSTSSSNLFHPTSFSWTINQINEFVSVDSLIVIFVQKHMGEPDLLSKSGSAVVHAALHS